MLAKQRRRESTPRPRRRRRREGIGRSRMVRRRSFALPKSRVALVPSSGREAAPPRSRPNPNHGEPASHRRRPPGHEAGRRGDPPRHRGRRGVSSRRRWGNFSRASSRSWRSTSSVRGADVEAPQRALHRFSSFLPYACQNGSGQERGASTKLKTACSSSRKESVFRHRRTAWGAIAAVSARASSPWRPSAPLSRRRSAGVEPAPGYPSRASGACAFDPDGELGASSRGEGGSELTGMGTTLCAAQVHRGQATPYLGSCRRQPLLAPCAMA